MYLSEELEALLVDVPGGQGGQQLQEGLGGGRGHVQEAGEGRPHGAHRHLLVLVPHLGRAFQPQQRGGGGVLVVVLVVVVVVVVVKLVLLVVVVAVAVVVVTVVVVAVVDVAGSHLRGAFQRQLRGVLVVV